VNTHLGEFVNYNDTLVGYDLNSVTLSDLEDYENIRAKNILPDCVMVRKCFPKVRNAQRKRIWKLKHMEKEAIDDKNVWADRKKSKKNQDQDENQKNKDYEMFLNDIEEDAEIRQNVNLYKDDDVIDELEKQLAGLALDDKKPEATVKKSSVSEALDKGQATVNGKERKVVKV
jgi:nonsense-mediated mRNA decay protein 3